MCFLKSQMGPLTDSPDSYNRGDLLQHFLETDMYSLTHVSVLWLRSLSSSCDGKILKCDAEPQALNVWDVHVQENSKHNLVRRLAILVSGFCGFHLEILDYWKPKKNQLLTLLKIFWKFTNHINVDVVVVPLRLCFWEWLSCVNKSSEVKVWRNYLVHFQYNWIIFRIYWIN